MNSTVYYNEYSNITYNAYLKNLANMCSRLSNSDNEKQYRDILCPTTSNIIDNA